MEQNKIQIDKNVLAPEDFENTKLITNDDGSQTEVYISRAGNIVTKPEDRSKNTDVERQQLCWDLYVKSLRSGRPSAKQAAISAGFSTNTAINIRSMRWFKDKMKTLRRASIAGKAERNLQRGLNVQWSKMKVTEAGEEVEEVDKDLFKTVMDVSKYIASTLLKDEGYSTKTEVSGNMDGEIKINSISYADEPKKIESQVVDKVIDVVENTVLEEVIGTNN